MTPKQKYCHDPKISDRQAWENSVDPGQTTVWQTRLQSDQGWHTVSGMDLNDKMFYPYQLHKSTALIQNGKQLFTNYNWAAAWQNQKNDPLSAQWRLCPVWSDSSLGTQWVA